MKVISTFLCTLLVLSCDSQNVMHFEFNPKTLVENPITLSDIADEIIYIPLDNQYPITDVHNPKITHNAIYLFTPNGIIAFGRDGKTSGKIGSRGRGPDEYLSGFNFTIDPKSETIYVLNRDKQIKVFSRNGKYIRSISLEDNVGSPDLIDLYDSNLFLSYFLQFDNAVYDWVILDTIGNIIKKKERSIPTFTSNFGTNSVTYIFDKGIHYWNPYFDTVFSILPDLSYRPSFTFAPGEHRIPKSNFNPSKPPNMIMYVRMIFETSRFWVIRYDYIRPIIVLIDKKSNKSFLSYVDQGNSTGTDISGGILNDLDGGVNFQPRCYFEENGKEYLIGLVNAYQIKAHVESVGFKNAHPKFPENKAGLKMLADSLHETDNPVIIMVSLR
jgi:hypothetical protein